MKPKSEFHLKTSLFFLLLTLLAASLGISAQIRRDPIVIGEKVTIRSEILNEERELLIYKPKGYDQSQEKYPVLYMLDPDMIFYYASGHLRGLHRIQRIPEVIAVGVRNTDRSRDMTPTKSNRRTGGGADDFIRFLGEELIPFVDTHYRTQPYRILFGISESGMFTIYTLLTAPDLFDAYLASSPSLWWDKRLLLTKAETVFEMRPKYGSEKFLFMALGGRDDIFIRDTDHIISSVKSFCRTLEKKAPDGLEWHLKTFEHGDHQTTPMFFLPVALETLYASWRLPQRTLEAGVQAIQDHYRSLGERFGYEFPVPESAYNRLGYDLVGRLRFDEAIEVFKLNVKLYPDSWNVYDSLGETYAKTGKKERAIENYEKSLELNPQNRNAEKMLVKLRGVEK